MNPIQSKIIIGYKVLYEFDEGPTIEEIVNEAIKDGWEPLGGVEMECLTTAQAMVKYAPLRKLNKTKIL